MFTPKAVSLLAKGMVLLSALGSIELFDFPQMVLPSGSGVVQVPADGLCFWSCLFLALAASPEQLWAWHMLPRSATGFPDSATYAEQKSRITMWALDIGRMIGQQMPPETRRRIYKHESAEHEDLDPW